jgi:bisphosphoglycerate-independent phosphoglycerate mutase (AlkP superfamily)
MELTGMMLDKTIKDGELNKNEVITDTFQKAKDGNGRLHLAVRLPPTSRSGTFANWLAGSC